jgi:hypothetical protein
MFMPSEPHFLTGLVQAFDHAKLKVSFHAKLKVSFHAKLKVSFLGTVMLPAAELMVSSLGVVIRISGFSAEVFK